MPLRPVSAQNRHPCLRSLAQLEVTGTPLLLLGIDDSPKFKIKIPIKRIAVFSLQSKNPFSLAHQAQLGYPASIALGSLSAAPTRGTSRL